MTDDASPENLRKFLKSDDPAMVNMGLSMAKGSEVPEELLGLIAGLYMWHDDKTVRAAARSTFSKVAPEKLKVCLKKNWKSSFRTVKSHENLKPTIEKFSRSIKNTALNSSEMWEIALFRESGNRSAIVYGIREMKDPLDLLCRGILDNDSDVQKSCKEIFIEIGSPSVPYLMKLLRRKNKNKVVSALGEIGDTRAVEPLVKLLKSNSSRLASIALGKIGGERAVEPLIEALEESGHGSWALGQIGDERAIIPIIESLKRSIAMHGADCNSYYNRGIKKALLEFDRDAIIEPVVELLDFGEKRNPDEFDMDRLVTVWNVRQSAARILYELGWKPETDELRVKLLVSHLTLGSNRYDGKWIDPNDELIKMGKKAVKYLITKLTTVPEKEIYFSYISKILREIGDAGAMEPLIKALEDDNGKVRYFAAEALGKIGDARAVEPLIKSLGAVSALHYLVQNYRSSAAKALGEIGDARAVEPLIKSLESPEIREAAVEALGKIGDERAVEPLVKMLGDEEKYVRSNAAEALGKIGDERVIDNLIGLLDDKDDYVLRHVNAALGKLGLSQLDITERKKKFELRKAKSYIDVHDISTEASSENLRKYLVSGENTLIRKGLAIMFDEGMPSELMGLTSGLYMWSDDKNVRASARKIFFTGAPEEIKELVKTTWKSTYRTIKSQESWKSWGRKRKGQEMCTKISEAFKGTEIDVVDMFLPGLQRTDGQRQEIAWILSKIPKNKSTTEIVINRIVDAYLEQKSWGKSLKSAQIDLGDSFKGFGKEGGLAIINLMDTNVVSPSLSDGPEILMQIKDKRGIPILIKTLEEYGKPSFPTRKEGYKISYLYLGKVVGALAELGGKEAADVLIHTMGDLNWGGPLEEEDKSSGGWNIRLGFLVNVASTLGNLGDKWAIKSLIKAQKVGIHIKNKDRGLEKLNSTAKKSLKKLGHEVE